MDSAGCGDDRPNWVGRHRRVVLRSHPDGKEGASPQTGRRPAVATRSCSAPLSYGKRCLDQGLHTSWATLREQLSTHQVVTVVLPATNGQVLKIRQASTPEPIHREIYRTLQIPHEVMKPVRTWSDPRV